MIRYAVLSFAQPNHGMQCINDGAANRLVPRLFKAIQVLGTYSATRLTDGIITVRMLEKVKIASSKELTLRRMQQLVDCGALRVRKQGGWRIPFFKTCNKTQQQHRDFMWNIHRKNSTYLLTRSRPTRGCVDAHSQLTLGPKGAKLADALAKPHDPSRSFSFSCRKNKNVLGLSKPPEKPQGAPPAFVAPPWPGAPKPQQAPQPKSPPLPPSAPVQAFAPPPWPRHPNAPKHAHKPPIARREPQSLANMGDAETILQHTAKDFDAVRSSATELFAALSRAKVGQDEVAYGVSALRARKASGPPDAPLRYLLGVVNRQRQKRAARPAFAEFATEPVLLSPVFWEQFDSAAGRSAHFHDQN